MYCGNCGNNVSGAPFCNRCGTRVANSQYGHSGEASSSVYSAYIPSATIESFNLFSALDSMFKKYATFSGRSRRQEYWLAGLVNYLLLLVWIFVVGPMIAGSIISFGGFGIRHHFVVGITFWLLAMGIYALLLIIPSLALTVRRLHDTGRSGLWWFIQLIPYVGSIILFVLMCIDGTPGSNQYGFDPKRRNGDYYR